MRSSRNNKPPFWIVDFGVKLKSAPLLQYSQVESYEDIPFDLSEGTELIILLDQEYFAEFKAFTRKNCKLILICDPNQSPPNHLFKEASYCINRNNDKLILDFLSPYLFQLKTNPENKVRQLHIVCDENGKIVYQDNNIFEFFDIKGSHEIKNFKDIPIKFRFGELKTFEPIEELLNVDKIDAWLNLRSTKAVEIFRVYVNKENKKIGDGIFHTISFNLWPKKSQLEENYTANVTAFTKLLEESFDAILITDTSRIIKYASPGITRLTGYSPEELAGRDTADFTLPEDAIKTHPIIAQVREAKKESVNVQHRIRHKNGNYIWIDVLVTDRRDTTGIMGIISSIRDIDAEKRSRLALEEWKRRFELASRATQDVIWDLDLRTGEITWGENVEDIFGWKSSEIATLTQWLEKIPNKDHSILNQSFNGIIEEKGDYWSCQFSFLYKNGKLASIEDRGYAIRDAEGNAYRVIGAMHDNSATIDFESQLIKGEEKFRRLFEESLIGVSLVKLDDFLCLDCNQALLNILGYRKEELLKMSFLELIPEEVKSFFFKEIDHLKNSEGAISFQLDLIRKDQSIIKVALSTFTIEEENNGTSAWMHILDLSPIIESSAALKAAENRFKSYIEKSSDIFATLDDQSIYEYVSPNITKLLGYHPSEVIGLHNFDLIYPDDHEAVIKAYSEADGEIGKVTRSTFRALHKDGSTLWVEASGKIENTEQGLKAFINIRDIEKEHKNEEELRRLSLVANKTENAVIITDAELKSVWVNKSYEQLSGYSLQETINEIITRKLFSTKIADALETEIKSGEVLKVERKAINKEGAKFWLELSITPVYDEDGLLKNYIFVALDIRKRKHQEKQIQHNLDVINEQNERLKSFAHISSHSFLAHCQNIEASVNNLKRTGNVLVQQELVELLNTTTQSLSASLASFQSILKSDKPQLAALEELNVKDFIEKAKRLLSNKIIEQLANIEYQGDPNFAVEYFGPYLEDALYTIFAHILEKKTEENISIIISTRESESYKVIELKLPGSLKSLNEDSPTNSSSLLFSFPESIELIKSQLGKYGAKLKLKSLDNSRVLLSLNFKDSN